MNYFFINNFVLKFCEANDIFSKTSLLCSISAFQLHVFFKYTFKQAFNSFLIEVAALSNFVELKPFSYKASFISNDQ
jgi:hypothetical protein